MLTITRITTTTTIVPIAGDVAVAVGVDVVEAVVVVVVPLLVPLACLSLMLASSYRLT